MRIKIQIRMERANALRLALAFLRNAHTNRSTRLIPGIRSRNSVQKKLEVFRGLWRFAIRRIYASSSLFSGLSFFLL